MSLPLFVKDAENRLLDRLGRIRSERTRWRAAFLQGSDMESAFKQSIRKREAFFDVYEVLKEADITAYFCKDGDVVFLFNDSTTHIQDILKKIVQVLLPQLNPDNIDFNTLFQFLDLAVDFDHLQNQIEEKAAVLAPDTSLLEVEAVKYLWDFEQFLKVLKTRTTRHSKLILVADDDRNTRLIASNILRSHYDVIMANDGYQALELYNNRAPDLLLLDPSITRVPYSDIMPIISFHDPKHHALIFTSNLHPISASHAKDIGAKDVVAKPFTTELILHAVQKALQ